MLAFWWMTASCVVTFNGEAFALSNLLRAYFEDVPPGSVPTANIGIIQNVPGAEVRVGEGQFPGGSMRITHDGDGPLLQQWTFSQHPPTGDGSLSWEMTVNNYPSGDFINLLSCFQEADSPLVYQCFSINFGPGGAILVNGRTLSVTYSANVRHQYRISHDMTTGRYMFYVDDEFADQGYFSVHQRMRWHHASLRIPDGYTGTLWIDNIRAVSARPWVAQVWSDFESYPLSSSLDRGSVPGYPDGDFLSDVVFTPAVDNLDVVVAPPGFAFGQSLRMRNRDTSGINFEFDPYADPPPDGRYRASYRYRQTGGSGQNKLLIVGSAVNFTLMNNLFENNVLYANSNLTKTAVASLQNQRTYHVEVDMDTVADRYTMDLDGYEVVPGWPVFDPGRPRKLKFGTGTAATDYAYLDDISLERRSRAGIFYTLRHGSRQFIQTFRDGMLEKDAMFGYGTNTVYMGDAVFGADGYLYVADWPSNSVHRIDAGTMQLTETLTDPALYQVGSLAPLADGKLLALVREGCCQARVLRLSTQPLAVEDVVLDFVSVNAKMVRMHPNGRRMYISVANPSKVIKAYRYPEMTPLADVTSINDLPSIGDFEVSPSSGLMYVVDGPNTNLVTVNPDTGERVGILQDLGHVGKIQGLCVLNNGDMAVGGQIGMSVLDGVTGRLLHYTHHNIPNTNGVFVHAIAAGPEMEITGVEKTADRTYKIDYQVEPTRWLDLELTSSLTTGTWAKVGHLYGTNYTMQVIHTHDPSRAQKGHYRITESGL